MAYLGHLAVTPGLVEQQQFVGANASVPAFSAPLPSLPQRPLPVSLYPTPTDLSSPQRLKKAAERIARLPRRSCGEQMNWAQTSCTALELQDTLQPHLCILRQSNPQTVAVPDETTTRQPLGADKVTPWRRTQTQMLCTDLTKVASHDMSQALEAMRLSVHWDMCGN